MTLAVSEIENVVIPIIPIDQQKDLGLGYAILFIGRIFIGYGYYQTIQAFRKYGKN